MAVWAALGTAPPSLAESSRPSAESARSLLGSYLAGRFARGSHESLAAARYYRDALLRDPGNEVLIRHGFRSEASSGDWERASRLADDLIKQDPNDRLARIFLGVREFKNGQFSTADEHFKAASSGPIGELTGTIARAWVAAAAAAAAGSDTAGRTPVDLLDGQRQAEWTQFYLRYHRALVADVTGRKDVARTAYENLFKAEPRTLRVALAYARHAAAAGDHKLARSVLKSYYDKVPGGHALAKVLRDDINAGNTVSMLVETPVQGLAEVFYGLGEALTNEGGVDVGAVYLQLALYLQPDSMLALAALANLYEVTKKYDLALSTYERITPGTPLDSSVIIRRAFNLNQLERVDEARKLLDELARIEPGEIRPLDALGNILRSHKRYDEAIVYYSRAIALIGPKPDKKHWSQYYSRGVCYERLKNWPAAEVDLLKALELSPDEPLILNYLGYSWVDQNKNLKKGMELIAKAVQKKPDDGYFVDSLGWAYYRQGNFKEAVRYLERAVELRPEDPTINDHLGDALWQVGRRIEARFQWAQALTLKPEPEDIDKIKLKLEKGLTSARAEPPKVVKKRQAARTEPVRKQQRPENLTRPAAQ